MKENVGEIDQYIRIILGAFTGLLSLVVLIQYNFLSQMPSSESSLTSLPEISSPILGFTSLLLITTAFRGKCGIYSVLGVNTCKAD